MLTQKVRLYVLMVVKIMLSWKQTTWSFLDRHKEPERTCCLLLQLFNPKNWDSRWKLAGWK